MRPDYVWFLPPESPQDSAAVDQLIAELGVDRLVATLLVNRGAADPADAHDRLHATLPRNLASGLPNCGQLARKLGAARASQCKVLAWGDYDVDGLVGASAVTGLLREAGIRAFPRVPERSDGYGFGPQVVQWAHDWGAGLIVTVDNGIDAHEALALAARYGIDVAITDHHQPQTEVAPEMVDGSATGLCGSAVAAAAIQQSAGLPAWALGPLALATAADCVPMLGASRALARAGLGAMRQSPPGLRALLALGGAGLDPSCEDLSYMAAPVLNSAGRMGQAKLALELLMSDDGRDACRVMGELAKLNRERKKLGADLLDAIDVDEGAALVWVVEPDCPRGMTGLVASKLASVYNLPAIVLARRDDLATGSVRMPHAGYANAVDLLAQCSDLLIRHGGHPTAAGLHLRADQVDKLHSRLGELLGGPDVQPMPPVLNLDLPLPLDQVNAGLVRAIRSVGPYGPGHRSPWFLVSGTLADDPATYSGGAHLGLSIERPGGKPLRAVAFWAGELAAQLASQDRVTLAARPFVSRRTGEVELKVKDIHMAKKRKRKSTKRKSKRKRKRKRTSAY